VCPARPGLRVVDAFIFHDEFELLDIRLRELDGVVDRFVIVESPWTFQGTAKPLHLRAHIERVAPWRDRIVLVTAEQRQGGLAWDQEAYQRDCILAGLDGIGNEDIVLLSDVDEIPRRDALAAVRASGLLASRLNRLGMDHYKFFLNFRANTVWEMAAALPAGLLRRLRPNAARFLNMKGGREFDGLIDRAGWHFSTMGGAAAVLKKVGTYSHVEIRDRVLGAADGMADALRAGHFSLEGMTGSYFGACSFVPAHDDYPHRITGDRDHYRRIGWFPAP
jgi:hypothetical protein